VFSDNKEGVLEVLYFPTTNQPTITKLNGKVGLTSIKETDKTQLFRLMPADYKVHVLAIFVAAQTETFS
jgi:hypothetical protein